MKFYIWVFLSKWGILRIWERLIMNILLQGLKLKEWRKKIRIGQNEVCWWMLRFMHDWGGSFFILALLWGQKRVYKRWYHLGKCGERYVIIVNFGKNEFFVSFWRNHLHYYGLTRVPNMLWTQVGPKTMARNWAKFDLAKIH